MSKNDVTGDEIKSKTDNQKAYEEGWERIFGKKEKKENTEEINTEPVDNSR